MKIEQFSFQSTTGNSLAASFDIPDGPTRAIALFAHCFTCGKDLRAARRLTAGLGRHGIATLRFDFTGLGASDGDFSHTNFSSNIDDLVTAADWLRQNHGPPSLLVGHSLGGAAVVAAAPRIPEIVAVATIGAPSDPSHVAHLFSDQVEQVAAIGSAEVSIGGRPFTVRKQFLDDIEQNSLQRSLETMDAAILVMHSPADSIVSPENGEALFALGSQPKSFIALDGADHLLSKASDASYAAESLAAWADKYLPPAVVASEDVMTPANEGEVVVTERGTGRFSQIVRVGLRYAFISDQPEGIGDGTGAAPYDLLLSALGACTNMTIRMFAERKNWPLETVTSTLRHTRSHHRDLQDRGEQSVGPAGSSLELIDHSIALAGELTMEQRDQLLQAAIVCPVTKTLQSNVRVSHTLDPL